MPTKMADIYDVLIVGAGPAGARAAARLASAGCRVYLIDAAKFPRTRVCVGRLSTHANSLLSEIGISIRDIITHEIKSVAFYNADLTPIAYPNIGDVAGHLVNRTSFDHQLAQAAVKAGAQFVHARPVVNIAIEERRVALTMPDGDSVRGRLLIMAAGRSRSRWTASGSPPMITPADRGPLWSKPKIPPSRAILRCSSFSGPLYSQSAPGAVLMWSGYSLVMVTRTAKPNTINAPTNRAAVSLRRPRWL